MAAGCVKRRDEMIVEALLRDTDPRCYGRFKEGQQMGRGRQGDAELRGGRPVARGGVWALRRGFSFSLSLFCGACE